jgi:hypothetical protein
MSRSNRREDVLSLQLALERAWQPRGGSNVHTFIPPGLSVAPSNGNTISRPIRIASPYGSSRATDAAAAFGRIPTKMRPPSRGGSGNKLNTASTTLIINAFFKLSTSHCALVAGK